MDEDENTLLFYQKCRRISRGPSRVGVRKGGGGKVFKMPFYNFY